MTDFQPRVEIGYSPYGPLELLEPTMIVVHCMGEYVDGLPAHEFLARDDIKLSAHAMIAPDGHILRTRADHERAWHVTGYNDKALGVEILVPGHHDWDSLVKVIQHPWVSPAQYKSALWLIRGWMKTFAIQRSQVVRHSDLSEIKPDPGQGFRWADFLDCLSNSNLKMSV